MAAPAPKQEELQPHAVKDKLLAVSYCLTSPSPWPEAILLGFQHYLVMLGTTVILAGCYSGIADPHKVIACGFCALLHQEELLDREEQRAATGVHHGVAHRSDEGARGGDEVVRAEWASRRKLGGGRRGCGRRRPSCWVRLLVADLPRLRGGLAVPPVSFPLMRRRSLVGWSRHYASGRHLRARPCSARPWP
ncbi:hypothetical protein ACP70R_042915 [Stipagrostis hirtigluma subsp. patula]